MSPEKLELRRGVEVPFDCADPTSHSVDRDNSASGIAPSRFHADAVLSVVNALRYASTRPMAGPSGIDDASARHVFSNYAMVASLSITRRWLTRESRRRMLTSSRRCRMALPPFAATAYGARIRPAPTGHGIERNPQNIAE